MSAARHGADARAGASSAEAARNRVAVEEVPGPAFASSSGGLSGALMSLVIFALFLIFIVTMTARYLRAGQPAQLLTTSDDAHTSTVVHWTLQQSKLPCLDYAAA
ncbi:hypothetical protein MRX96_048854 [Rhipicephalus microplus]